MLKQRSKFVTYTFKLAEVGVRVERKTWFGRKEFLVKYGTIPTTVSRFTERSKKWFWLGVVTALIGLLVFADNLVQDVRNFAPVCYLTFSLLFWLLFWQSHSAWVGFYCLDGSRLFFVDGIPSDAAVKDFIRRVQETKVKVLRRHLMKRLGDIYAFSGELAWSHIYDELTKLQALDILSETDFNRLKKELLDNFEHFQQTHPIGIDVHKLH